MESGFHVPDGNEALRSDIPAIVELIERTARWVHPDTFRALPVWAPHYADNKIMPRLVCKRLNTLSFVAPRSA